MSEAAADAAIEALREIGRAGDSGFPLADAALTLASLDSPGGELAPYRAHLDRLANEVGVEVVRRGGAETAAERAAVLAEVLAVRNGYAGDRETYDDLANANLMRVIDRRCGLPVALAILWLHAGRAQGWPLSGLNVPSHFLIRIDGAGDSEVVDPFEGGSVVGPERWQQLGRALAGQNLDVSRLQTVSDRGILLRLQNNLKLRHARAGRISEAVAVAERMVLIAPRDAAVWQECGRLHAEEGSLLAALTCLDRACELVSGDDERERIRAAQQVLRGKLN